MELLNRITQKAQVCGGRPCIRGMRMPISVLLGLLAAGRTFEEILDAYPYVEREDIFAALACAAWLAEEVPAPANAPWRTPAVEEPLPAPR